MKLILTFAVGAALLISAPSIASADPTKCGDCEGNNGNGLGNIGAPGPVEGAGLPFLIAAGAYAVYRVRKNRKGATPVA